jgi:hypothetical protein
MIEKGYIEFKTHGVVIRRDTETASICCLKTAYRNGEPCCDIEVFQSEEEAVEWILKPFPKEKAIVVFE